jgi:hypothetical protein
MSPFHVRMDSGNLSFVDEVVKIGQGSGLRLFCTIGGARPAGATGIAPLPLLPMPIAKRPHPVDHRGAVAVAPPKQARGHPPARSGIAALSAVHHSAGDRRGAYRLFPIKPRCEAAIL